jgi:hypothetical protein
MAVLKCRITLLLAMEHVVRFFCDSCRLFCAKRGDFFCPLSSCMSSASYVLTTNVVHVTFKLCLLPLSFVLLPESEPQTRNLATTASRTELDWDTRFVLIKESVADNSL